MHRFHRRPPSTRRALAAVAGTLAVATSAALAPQAHADAFTWTGASATDDNFSSADNWGGAAPNPANSPADSLTFDGATRLTPNNDFTTATFGGLTFAPTAGSFTLGGNPLTLAGDLNQNSPNPQTLSLGLIFNGGASNINAAPAAGALALGAVTFGANSTAPFSNTVSTLNVNTDLTAASLLVQTDTSAANTLNIASGKTLTVNGAFVVGANTNLLSTSGVKTTLAVSGAGATLAIDPGAANVLIGQLRNNADAGTDPAATLDLSGLDNFSSSGTGDFRVGYGGNITGHLTLANASNAITASAIRVGDSNNANNGNASGGDSNLTLGPGANSLNANTLVLGNGKSAGNLNFAGADGSVTIAKSTGATDTAITVGQLGSASGTSSGSNFLLAGHNATVTASTLIVGRTAGSNSSGNTKAVVTFDTGTFTTNSLQIADNNATSTSSTTTCSGTYVLGGPTPNNTATGTLNVNSQFLLGSDTNSGAGSADIANFVVNGGTANINADITTAHAGANTADAANITLAGGTLNMMGHAIGSAAAPIAVTLPDTGQTATLANLGGAGINANGLNMTGAGTLLLAGNNTYTGPTTVTNGALGGTGALAGPVSITAPAHLAPGDSIGTLTINNTLTDNGQSDFELDKTAGNLTNDKIAGLTATPDFTGATLNLTLTGAGFAAGDAWDLFDWTGPAVDPAQQFAAINQPPAPTGLAWDNSQLYSTGVISLVSTAPVPEPTTLALLALPAATLLNRRRRPLPR